MPTPTAALQSLEDIGHTPESLYWEAMSESRARHPGLQVVALPGERLTSPMAGAGGDVLILVRVAPGEPGLGCLAALAVAELASSQQLRAQGITVEEGPPGGYAVVIEKARYGPRRARRITDAGGVVPPGQLLLRVRGREEAEEAFVRGGFDGDDDPSAEKGLKAWDDSPEVPDLLLAEAKAIAAELALARAATLRSDRLAAQEKALKLMLMYLQRSDAKRFATEGPIVVKIRASEGRSKTTQGERFAVFLVEYLEKFAEKIGKKRNTLKKADVTAALKALKLEDIPKEDRDILVQISTGHFASMSLLYSTVRHEWVHVEQLRAHYLAFITTEVLRSVPGPDNGTLEADFELEAYLWEMENLAGTGLKDPGEVLLVWKQASENWEKAGTKAKNTHETSFKAALAAAWTLAVEGHLTAIAAHHAKFRKDGSVENGAGVRTLFTGLEQLWKHRSRFGVNTPWKAKEAGRAAALVQCEEMLAKVVSKDLEAADNAVAGGGLTAEDAFKIWLRLLNLPKDELPRSVVVLHEARFKTTAPPLWEKAFTGFAQEIRKNIAEGNVGAARSLLDVRIETLWSNRAASNVVERTFSPVLRALQDEVRKATRP